MPTTTSAPDYTLLTAERVIDAKGGPPIEKGAVLVRGSDIINVGPSTKYAPPMELQ